MSPLPPAPVPRWSRAAVVALLCARCLTTTLAAPAALSAEQRRWLTNHPGISLASDPSWPPFSFSNGSGRIEGIDADLLALIEARLEYQFTRVPVKNWSEALERARSGAIDVLSGTARVSEREDTFVFTASYVSHSIGIVSRREEPLLATLAQLKGRRIAVVRDHAVTRLLQRDCPDAQLVFAERIEDALHAVARGDADAVLANLVNASYLIKQRGLTNLKIAGIAPYRFEMRFAVRRDWPELAEILNVAIASLSEAEKQRAIDHWVRVEYDDMVRRDHVVRLIGWSLLAVALGAGIFLWHTRRLRRELLERVKIERQLREAHGKLTRLNAEKTEIINMAAHELRNPLTGVLLSAQVMAVAPVAEQRRLLGDITLLCRRMLRLIGDLLDAQMLEEGRRVLQTETIDLARVVREVAADNRMTAERKQIAVRLENVSAPLLVHADAGAVRQVVDNFASNAIKFSPIGGQVWLTLDGSVATARLAVRDHGPGIATEDFARLFTKYGRLGHRPSAGETSIGLGLAIVRQLVEAMDGRVWCESELGRGATFFCELPLAAPAPTQSASLGLAAGAISPSPLNSRE